jgi:glycosyltransferase involved in cell wall biosynthesis
MNPKVSIIIPVYNGSNFLKEAIDSALVQTYKNLEIIIVNDGSNDNGATERIAKSYGDRIKYYKKKNGGVATALNFGIEKMTGEYFSWLSHDDMYYPGKIEKQIAFLNNRKDKKVVLYSNFSVLENEKISKVVLDHEMLTKKKKYSLLRGCVNGITVLVPKLILDDTGIFKSDLKYTQDYDYWMRVQNKYPLIHIKDVLSITRFHPKQESRTKGAIPECNRLWIEMIENLDDTEKLQYEGSLYGFYYEMVKFLKSTPYDGVLKYCEDKLKNIEYRIYEAKNLDKISSDVIGYINIRAKESEDRISALESDNLIKVTALKEENKHLADTIEGIYNSKSWKITKPLRGLILILRGLLNK